MAKKFRVRSVEFRVHEDSWKDGEGKLLSIWGEEDLSECSSIAEALKKIPHFSQLDQVELWWNDPVKDNDFSRFDADAIVDWDFGYDTPTMDVSVEAKKEWEAGKRMLYNMHATAYVEAISDLTADDVKDFKYKE